jgi:hypothetical protein
VNPLHALLTLNPILSIGVSVLTRLKIDLTAEVAVLIVGVGGRAHFAQPEELTVPELSAGPLLSFVPIRFKSTEFISASSEPSFRD